MRVLLVFGAGLVAMAISTVARAYASWLLHKVAGDAETGGGFLGDFFTFLHALVQEVAARSCGRRLASGGYWSNGEYVDPSEQW